MTRNDLITILITGGDGVGLDLNAVQITWIMGFVDEYAEDQWARAYNDGYEDGIGSDHD